jgi:hypothetical protein
MIFEFFFSITCFLFWAAVFHGAWGAIALVDLLCPSGCLLSFTSLLHLLFCVPCIVYNNNSWFSIKSKAKINKWSSLIWGIIIDSDYCCACANQQIKRNFPLIQPNLAHFMIEQLRGTDNKAWSIRDKDLKSSLVNLLWHVLNIYKRNRYRKAKYKKQNQRF